jgi:serine/threonine protein kinase
MDEFAGTARFELRRCLGRGGFGIVYEALDRDRGALVALKVLRVADAAALYRFKREFRILADLAHPNLVALDELLTDGSHWFFTMELIDGRPLVQHLRSVPPAPPIEAPLDVTETRATWPGAASTATSEPQPAVSAIDEARVRQTFVPLVETVAAIHKSGIVHRDIKPSNVLVTPEGRVVVLDFGLATELASDVTSVGSRAGTPAYMAPEQALGQTPTAASDWYSVGVMLYEALAGRLPFTGTVYDILLAKQQPAAIDNISTGAASELVALSVALLDPAMSRRPNAEEILRCLKSDGASRVAVLPPRRSPPAPPLIGRDAHLRALAAAFDTASTGRSVVVFMPGRSGVGKSALMRRFVEDLRQEHPAAVVLSGRCHERESVPYKAVDGLVDQLARYLERLSGIETARLLPRDAPLIARLFPVLLGVEEIDRARTRAAAPLDSLEVRRRAATALRDLLSAVSDQSPLVVTIDDLQWGDLDSASLLQEILRLPEPPALLLLAAYRSEDAHAPVVRTLRDWLLHDADRRDIRTLEVEELTLDQAYELAVRELASPADTRRDRATEIARESGGNAFFVHELVHHTATVGGPVRLDTVIRRRVSPLPADAQQLLTAVALSAQPVIPVVAAAALGNDPHAAVRLLRAARLIRIHERADGVEIETYHHRIRESVREAVDGATLKSWHARLAAAWERSGAARPETLVTHFRGAEDRPATARYAALAADAAEQALAFDRAAQYYRLLLEVGDREQQPEWHRHLGDVLANAGRGHAAAAAYLNARASREPEMVIELERRAAEQLIRSGHLNEAREVLRSLLPKIGITPARTEAGAFAGVVLRRLLLALRGTRIRERPERDIPAFELQRIDTLWAVGAPLSLIELAHGNDLHLRGMWLVLRVGEPKRAVRGLTTLACASAMAGARHEGRTRRFLGEAKRLAARLADPTSTARTMLAEGICHKVNGRWLLAREHLERAIAHLTPCPGVRWEIETARTLLHDTLFWIGDWKQLFDEIPARRQEAEDRGDLYSATHVAVRLAPIALLAADQPDRARGEAIASMARWPSTRFDLQHRFEVCSLIEADLYAGRATDAANRLRAAWPRLRWIRYAFQNGRIEMYFYRARIALARAAEGKLAHLRRADQDASRLERERAPWATALAALVRGSVRATAGDRDAAIDMLAAAERALCDGAMAHYAAAARYRRGQLLAGDEGRALVTAASAWFTDQGVVNIERMVGLLAPGQWSRGSQGEGPS